MSLTNRARRALFALAAAGAFAWLAACAGESSSGPLSEGGIAIDDGGGGLLEGPPPLVDAAADRGGFDGAVRAADGVAPSGDGASPTSDSGSTPSSDSGSTPTSDSAGGVTDYPLPAIPTACTFKAKVITYNPNGWGTLLDAFEATPTACADYFIFLPAIAGNKTQPRAGGTAAAVRARKGRFHAVAEFHFGAWSKVGGMTWYQRGVEFRRRMDAAGYNVARGDTWAINELPSSTRNDSTVRANIQQLVAGLYSGPGGGRARAGIVFVVGMGQGTINHAVYKPALKSWLSDATFWNAMNRHVLYWGQETYVSPAHTCVPNAQVGLKALRVNEYAEHPARLAAVGPAAVQAARTFFNVAYFPTLTAVWNSSLYGQTVISLDAMKHLVSLETYATRAWAAKNNVPDGRIGFAWDNNAPSSTLAQRVELAQRLAAAIAGAYAVNGSARHACSPSGAYTWCGCSVSGATFNDRWGSTYSSW